MFPDSNTNDNDNNKEVISKFPPPWLKQNPKITMQLPTENVCTKGYVSQTDNDPQIYLLETELENLPKIYIYIFLLHTQQLERIFDSGLLPKDHAHLINNSIPSIPEL